VALEPAFDERLADGLADDYLGSPHVRAQWELFLSRSEVGAVFDLAEVADELRERMFAALGDAGVRAS